jgi:hypothetical protein
MRGSVNWTWGATRDLVFELQFRCVSSLAMLLKTLKAWIKLAIS